MAAGRVAINNNRRASYEAMSAVKHGPPVQRVDSGRSSLEVGDNSRTVYAIPRSVDSTESSDEEDGLHSSICRRRGHALLESHTWSCIVMSAIAANTLMMAAQCEFKDWPWWFVLEDGFLIFFTFEMTIRLCVLGRSFFTDSNELAWNIFDLFVVFSGLLDWFLRNMVQGRGGHLMVALRIVRIVRILRSCRLLKHFKQLYLLVQGFLHSLQAVFWIGVLFFLVVLIAGIIVTSSIGANASLWGPAGPGRHYGEGDEEEIKKLFGSLPQSMITMFQLVTLDNWGSINSLVAKQMPGMTLFFIGYILVTAFAMIALLTGVITENVNAVSQDSERADAEEAFQKYVNTLETVFRRAEAADGQDGITLDEFAQVLKDPKVAEKIEIDQTSPSIPDLHDIFRAMDSSGDGKVSWDEFRRGLKDIQGPASAREVALLRADMSQLQGLIAGITGGVTGGSDVGLRIAALEGQVKRLEGTVQGFLAAMGR